MGYINKGKWRRRRNRKIMKIWETSINKKPVENVISSFSSQTIHYYEKRLSKLHVHLFIHLILNSVPNLPSCIMLTATDVDGNSYTLQKWIRFFSAGVENEGDGGGRVEGFEGENSFSSRFANTIPLHTHSSCPDHHRQLCPRRCGRRCRRLFRQRARPGVPSHLA